jgi:hypothetical protein
MAIRFPARVKAKTSTTGTGAYTISEATPAAGYRTFTQAVTDGDLANGDQVPYIVLNTTVTNGPKLLEIVLGTWNNTAKTLTRDTVYQPNATPVSWGASTQDVLVIDNPAMFLLLAGGTLTGILRILLSGAIISPAAETGLVVQRSATAATEVGLSLISGTSGKSRLNMGDTADEDAGGWVYDQATNTMICRTNGVDRQVIDSAGVLKTSASGGNTYDAFAGSGATKVPFYMATAPAGWTKDVTQNDKAMRVVSGVSGGTSGGSRALSAATTGSHILTVAELPEHTHNSAQYVITGVSPYSIPSGGTGSTVQFVDETGTTGSDSPHDHPLALAYIDLIVCSKN